MIYIIEGARCSDTYEAMETAVVTKIHKYRAMREELRRGSTEWEAEPRAGTRSSASTSASEDTPPSL